MPYYCSVCKKTISEEVHRASMNKFDKDFCNEHQKIITPQALKLYKALKEKGANPILEYDDGFKHVDIAVEWAKLYIEIDGSHHLFSPKQVIADYKRDNYSQKDEFYTKRFSNTSIDEDVRSVAECISDLASLRYREISNNQKENTPNGISTTVVETPPKKSREIRKATLTLASVILILCLLAFSFIMSNRVGTLQTANTSFENQVSALQNDLDTLQSQYDQLNSEYQQLISGDTSSQTSQITSLQNQITDLQNQIASLQSQLTNATDTIAQLRGQTGILPTSMDLGWVGPDLNHGDYFLQLALKNTGNIPINQIYITINSVQMGMTFTYLNNTVSVATPLPPYEIATGIQDVTPPVDHPETYPLLIQATASNGTIYTYQTTITSHV